MLDIFFILLMGWFARGAGGGMGAKYLNKKGDKDSTTRADLGGIMPIDLTWLCEFFFALPFGYGAMRFFDGGAIVGVIAAVISYFGMQASTAPGIGWGKNPDRAKIKQDITPIVNFIAARLGFAIGDINYCRAWMAVKGFLIGLPVGALPLMILWPCAYEFGNRLKPSLGNERGHAIAEFSSGCMAGIAILLVCQ